MTSQTIHGHALNLQWILETSAEATAHTFGPAQYPLVGEMRQPTVLGGGQRTSDSQGTPLALVGDSTHLTTNPLHLQGTAG